MALGENQNKIQYTVTTSDDSFDFPYKYWASSEMVVTKLASGVETSPSFTLAPTNGDTKNGCTVTLDSAVESCTITIERIVAFESEANYQRGALSQTGLTEQFDKGVALSQQLNEKFGRVSVAPATDPSGLNYAVGTVSERAGKADGWDENGNKVALSIATEGGAYGSVDTTKGLGATSGGTLFAKVDDVTTEFDAGNIVVKAVDTAQLVDEGVTLAKVDGSALSGSDATLVTGTAGDADDLLIWDANGDAVSAGESVVDILADAATASEAYVDGGGGFTPVAYTGGESVTLPNGLVMKFGNTTDANAVIVFDDAFETALLSVTVTENQNADRNANVNVHTVSKSGFTMYVTLTNTKYWMAIGY